MRSTFIALAILACSTTSALAERVWTLDGQGALRQWNTSNLSTPLSAVVVNLGTGGGGQPIIFIPRDIDFRPSNRLLYGIDSSGVYTINTSTGLATLVGPLGIAISDPVSMDFNPVTDEIRVSAVVAGQFRNLRFNPDTGALIANDSAFTKATSPATLVNVTGIAHTNPIASAPAGSTRLYATYLGGQQPNIQHFLGEIGSQAGGEPSFNSGVVTDIGTTGLSQFGLISPGGFDIAANGVAYHAYSIGTGGGRTQHLVTLDLATGAFTTLGRLGTTSSTASNLGVAIPPPPCFADANASNSVDAADLSILLSQFGSSVTPGTGADFNADGMVDSADLSILLSDFGRNC